MNPLTQNERFTTTINNWKGKLLDLSKRNRALNFKVNKVSTITIVDEEPSEIFKLLCLQEKALKFLPQIAAETAPDEQKNETDEEESENDLPAPDFVPYEAANLANRHTDDFLQTNSVAEKLDKSLRRLEEQANSVIEEQGVNALFLSLGTLHYNESRDSKEFYKAPLILVPVELSRKSARGGFTIEATEDEIIINPSLIEFLRRNFSIALPEIPDSSQLTDDYDVQHFFAAVADAISNQTEWKIKNEIYLALFSFQKLVMYKDLERNAENLAAHKIIGKIISKSGEQINGLPDEIREMSLDRDFPPEATAQVVDADSSQLRAISTVAKNYDLVLEGPPGTGKSQTITNLVAQSLSTGKTVLFVAEKMAALEVVHRRLVAAGLGEFCLELHSTKANKRAVMQEIRNALDASLQKIAGTRSSTERIPVVREQLTAYIRAVHAAYGALNLSPYRIYGELGTVLNAPKFALQVDVFNVSQTDLTDVLRDLKDLSVASEAVGSPAKHAWRETTKTFYTESDFDQIETLGADLKTRLEKAIALANSVETNFGLPPIRKFADIETAASIASVMVQSPGAPLDVLNSEAWNSPPPEAKNLIEKGRDVIQLGEQAAQTPFLRNQDYERLSLEAVRLIEKGRRIINIHEQVLKVKVLTDEMGENFVVETHSLIERGFKTNNLRGQIPRIQILSNEIYKNFDYKAAVLIEKGRETNKLGERLRETQILTSEIYEQLRLQAKQLIEKGRRIVGLRERIGKSFYDVVSEQNPTDDISYVEQKSSGFFGFLAFLDGRFRAIKKRWLSYRLPSYQATLIEQTTEMKMVADLWRTRQKFEAESTFGHQLFGSLWEGEDSNWQTLENFFNWILDFRRFFLEDGSIANIANLLLLEDEASKIRAKLTEHQQAKELTRSYLASWEAMEKDLRLAKEYLSQRQELEKQNSAGIEVFGSLWEGEHSNWHILQTYVAWILDFQRLCVEGGLYEDLVKTNHLENDLKDLHLLETKVSNIYSILNDYRQTKDLSENYLTSLKIMENDLKVVGNYFRESQELRKQNSKGISLFGSLWEDENSNWSVLKKYAAWVLAFCHLCFESKSISNFADIRLIKNQAKEIRADFDEHLQSNQLSQNYLMTWEKMEKDLETLDRYFRERQELKEQNSTGIAFFGSLWESENSNWNALEKFTSWTKDFRQLCIDNNLHKSDLSWKNTSAKNIEKLHRLEEEAEKIKAIILKYQEIKNLLHLIESKFSQITNLQYQQAKNLLQTYSAFWLALERDFNSVSNYLKAKQNIEAQSVSGSQLFGALWRGEASDFSSLENYISWVLEFRRLCIGYGLREQAAQTASRPAPDMTNVRLLAQEAQEIQNRLEQFCNLVGWRENYFENANLPNILGRISELTENLNLASRWAAFETVRQKAAKGVAAELLNEAMNERFAFADLEAIFRRAFYQKWLAQVVQEREELLHFQTLTHEERVKEFRELDERVLSENRAELVGSLREKLQADLQKPEMRTAMNFLRGQLAKQRKLAPLRVTMKHAFQAIRAIKRCFMMSPQTVAQLLENADDKFDVVIFDEASQMPTEEAVGAVLRGKQLVVVGDPKQLPPTNFFAVQSGTVNVQYDEDGLPLYDDSQSILEEVAGAGVANSRLKWHYRSAQESLITFSNVSFYDGDLYTFPSVETDSYDTGLHFEYVEDGVYEGKGLNLIEARRVADAVVEHAKTKPEISLGVGTFNMRQQLAVLDELEQRRRLDPSLEPFFDRSKSEPFFVKNLENIQGDERDAIFLSVTYAKAHDGRLRYNFGPLNGENGWRRLNVLTTRARKLMRVFSSIKGEDINPVATVSQGAQLLRDFLTYAEHKRLDSPVLSAVAETESPFERDVMQELTRRGIRLVPQVGVSGYRIDLGVLDSEIEGRFVCGIECDGVAYHSSATARDRDRLRQQVLESRGWEIHRIWSTDWFKDRHGQIERLLNLIEKSRQNARREHDEEREREKSIQAENEKLAREFLGEISDGEIDGIFANVGGNNYVRPEASEYEFAEISNFVSWQTFLDAPTAQLAQAILQIVEIESPIHFKDLTIRAATAWGTRTGSRITNRIAEIVQFLQQANRLSLRGDFIWKLNGDVQLRSRNGTQIPAERIAPEEVQEAILQVLRAGQSGFTRPELVNEARAVFGFNRTGASLQQIINDAVDALLIKGSIGEGSLGIALRE